MNVIYERLRERAIIIIAILIIHEAGPNVFPLFFSLVDLQSLWSVSRSAGCRTVASPAFQSPWPERCELQG